MSIHVCKNCGNTFSGRFCNNCGEKVFKDSDKSLRHLAHDFFHFIFHFEGSFLYTIKTMFSKPGRLSLDYCDGIRKPYFKPLSLFLLLVVIYLLFPFFPGLNQDLIYYTKNRYYGSSASDQISEIMLRNSWTFEELSQSFHEKGAKASKFLLVLLIPLSALVMWIFAFRRKRFFYDHMIFAAEFNSFVILLIFLVMPLIFAIILFFFESFGVGPIYLGDDLLAFIIAPVLLIFLFFAVKRFYTYNLMRTILFSIAFTFAYNSFVMVVYKFILFNIVIWSV